MSPQTDEQELVEFFTKIWKNTEGYVYVPTKNSKTDEWTPAFYEWPEHSNWVARHVLSATAKKLDVYFAPALFSEPKAEKKYVKGSHVVWADFDGNAPDDWGEAQNGSSEGSSGPSPGLRGVSPPTVQVQSSIDGHEHLYWELDSFQEDTSWIDNVNRSIAYTLRADTSGWDCNQVLRPPLTTNYKHDLPVTVAQVRDIKYPLDAFKELKTVPQIVGDSIDFDNLPAIENLIAEYKWSKDSFDMFMSAKIEEGKRSSALMRLGFEAAEMGMTEKEIYALLDNADARWGKFAKRNDRTRRLLDIVNRAKIKHPTGVDSLTFAGLTGEREATVNLRQLYQFQDFMDEDIQVEWIIEGLIEKNGVGMIASKPGVGKTQLMLQMAICCAIGIPFLGHDIPTPQRVIFFSLEMGRIQLRKFLDTIAQHYTDEQKAILQENLFLVPLGEALSVHRNESMSFIQSLMDEAKPQGVFIDSVAKLSGGELTEKSAMTINEFYSWIRARNDVFVWVIHHNRKPNMDKHRPVDLEDIYGPVWLTSDLSYAMILWKDEGFPKNQIEVFNVKNRFAEEESSYMIERDSNLFFTVQKTISQNILDQGEEPRPAGPSSEEGEVANL